MSNKCELCERKKLTKWYLDEKDWWIADCKTCGKPMIVYNHHEMNVKLSDVLFILQIVYSKFGKVKIRFNQRKVKDHLHWHII
jgi:hypothetical protein